MKPTSDRGSSAPHTGSVRPCIVAGNWKHNPSRGEGEALAREVVRGAQEDDAASATTGLLIIPPLPYLATIANLLCGSGLPTERVTLGAQDLSPHGWGAFTGEVGGALLREFGATRVLVGHSERRQLFGDTDETVAEKTAAAIEHDLVPIVCVGETEEERDRGETMAVLERQIGAVLKRCPAFVAGTDPDGSAGIIAYEPVWAIGTGRTATPELAEEAHAHLRQVVARERSPEAAAATPILYGGSVKPENARELLSREEIDGALVGGASLSAESFLGIARAAPIVA